MGFCLSQSIKFLRLSRSHFSNPRIAGTLVYESGGFEVLSDWESSRSRNKFSVSVILYDLCSRLCIVRDFNEFGMPVKKEIGSSAVMHSFPRRGAVAASAVAVLAIEI